MTTIEKIQKLVDKGFGLNVATVYYWTELKDEEKKALKFRQVLWLWKHAPAKSSFKKEFWALLETFVLMFDEKILLWRSTSPGTIEEEHSWKKLKESATDFRYRKILFQKISADNSRKFEIWELIKEMAKSPQELVWVLKKSPEDEKNEAWRNVWEAIENNLKSKHEITKV